jgi:hypothetical protein
MSQINAIIHPHPISLITIIILFIHYVLALLVISFLLAFPPIAYMHFSSLQFVLHALPISLFLTYLNFTWRRVQVMKLLLMQLFSNLPLLYHSLVQISSSEPSSQTPCAYVLNIRDQVSHPYRRADKIIALCILILTSLDSRHEDK